MASLLHMQPRLGSLILLVLALVGCKPANKFVPPPPAEVTVAKPIELDVVNTVEFTGTTRAMKSVELRARVNGYLKEIKFKDGADVKKGDLLFVIDQEPFNAEVDISTANLERAEATLELAEANLARTTQLASQNASSAQQVDLSKAERSTAVANVNAAIAQLKQAKLNLDYTKIHAPIDGRIGTHLIDEGNLVRSEESILAIIESIDPIHVDFYVGERDLLWFMKLLRENKLPDPAKTPPVLEMRLENETEFKHAGHLVYRALGVDPQTGTVLRRGLFYNDDGFLIPGLFVHIRARVGEGVPELLVEERAISTDQRGDYILIVNKENKVEYRPIKPGISVGNMRVIEEGVAEGEWLVINGLQRARPDTVVKPIESVMKVEGIDEKVAQPKKAAKTEPKPEVNSEAQPADSTAPKTQPVSAKQTEKPAEPADQTEATPLKSPPASSAEEAAPAEEVNPVEPQGSHKKPSTSSTVSPTANTEAAAPESTPVEPKKQD